MKTFRIFTALMMMQITAVYAQNSQPRQLPAFSKIEIEDRSKVILHSGAVQSVTVESEDLNEVETEVENGKLTIGGQPSKIDITIPELTEVEISGYGQLIADSTIRTQHLRLNISGNGKIAMAIEVSRLDAGISGYGKMILSGNAETLDLNISGNGKMLAEDLSVSKAHTDMSGVGKAYVDVKDELKLSISGTGGFYYKNKPAVVESNISGIGKYGDFQPGQDSDTTSIGIGNKKIIIINKEDDDDDDDSYNWDEFKNLNFDISTDTIFKKPAKAKSHWSGFEIGFNTLLNESDLPSYMELNSGKSVNVNLNFFSHDFQIYKRYVMFTTGIGLTLNNYRFTSDSTLQSDSKPLSAARDYDKNGVAIVYKKNKLAVNYVTVPLLLQFNTNEFLKKSFHVGMGILLSYKYNSHLKLVDEGNNDKSKRRDEFNIDPFRYDATIRLGYQNYTVYASYALSELFKSDRGPELHPFQFGISLSGW